MPTDTPTNTPMPTATPTPEMKAPAFNQAQVDEIFLEIKRAIQNKDQELFDRFVEAPFGRETFWGLAMRNNLVSFDTFFDAKHTGGNQIEVALEGTIDRTKKKLSFWLSVEWKAGQWRVTQWSDRSEAIFDEAEMDRLLLKILQAFQRRDKALFDEYNKSKMGESWWNTMKRDNRIPKSFNGTYLSSSKFKMEMIIEDDEGDKKRDFELTVSREGDRWVITDWVYKR